MARGERAGDGVPVGGSDARLVALLRAAPATAYPALRELRARHDAALLAYARLCTSGDPAARRLAAQAFTPAARETARGTDPGLPWRHQLLLLAARVAGEWAADERAAGLDPGLLLVLNTAGPRGPVPPLLTAFQSLSSRDQGLLWYGVVEREPVERTAALLGLTPADVSYGVAPALQSLAGAALRHRLAASDDPRCPDFRRLIEQSVRTDAPRPSPDLDAHEAHCPHCATAHEEQRALRDAPRGTLAEGLLPWAGTAYAAEDRDRPAPHSPGAPESAAVRPPGRRLVLVSAALGVALAPLLVLLIASGDPSDQQAAGAASSAPPSVPPVTVTATVSVPAPVPSPSRTSASASPSPTRTKRPPSPRPTPKPTPTPSPTRAPGAAFAQVVNVASGRCLEVAGDFSNGTDVLTVPCSSSVSQRWRFDAGRGVLQSAADPDFCLDSRGSVDRGVGVWTCSSVYGGNGENLMFLVDPDGTVRPAIALETALAEDGYGGLAFARLDEGADQRWRAGAR
ncbi:ricin-type beta-trefoil lectin domain protein [Streptomyces longwoodensis]|uniref:ricin-type beta-trefoil lectin domain protein n=1 Tax=Streptomyces longwoodensis TaxID=68231 RepID=UPI0036BBF8E9